MTLRSAFIAMTTSLALAVANPAAAKTNKDDLAAFLAIVAGLALLANQSGAQPVHQPQPFLPQPHHPQPHHPQPHHPKPFHPQPHHPRPHQPVRHELPRHCAISIQTKYGWQTVYTEHCLWRAGYRRDLPRACAARVRGEGGWNQVFTEYCLRRNGY